MVPQLQPVETCDRRFPRTRGDGPSYSMPSLRRSMVPPHPRGWSRRGVVAGAHVSGSPAPAGMVPVPVIPAHRSSRFPRTRGDGPGGWNGTWCLYWVPPHPRGWSRLACTRRQPGSGSPAPAGMVPSITGQAGNISRFPRTRGDGPDLQNTHLLLDKVPPHPRGWSFCAATATKRPRGSPAPAGMVPCSSTGGRWTGRFPRTRGDGPFVTPPPVSTVTVPPHPRGWSHCAAADRVAQSGSPAPAGMVPGLRHGHRRIGGFPRTRGDGPSCGWRRLFPGEVPPHPRRPSRSRARKNPHMPRHPNIDRPAVGGRRSSLPPNQYAHRWIFSRRPGPCLLQGSAGP